MKDQINGTKEGYRTIDDFGITTKYFKPPVVISACFFGENNSSEPDLDPDSYQVSGGLEINAISIRNHTVKKCKPVSASFPGAFISLYLNDGLPGLIEIQITREDTNGSGRDIGEHPRLYLTDLASRLTGQEPQYNSAMLELRDEKGNMSYAYIPSMRVKEEYCFYREVSAEELCKVLSKSIEEKYSSSLAEQLSLLENLLDIEP
ncbi:hypothetical protein JW796_00300 [Candidatus Dojkabacteria bacterium]|nr:hypothetical protein [Candidatus Dojkabacteria bacterium]